MLATANDVKFQQHPSRGGSGSRIATRRFVLYLFALVVVWIIGLTGVVIFTPSPSLEPVRAATIERIAASRSIQKTVSFNVSTGGENMQDVYASGLVYERLVRYTVCCRTQNGMFECGAEMTGLRCRISKTGIVHVDIRKAHNAQCTLVWWERTQ